MRSFLAILFICLIFFRASGQEPDDKTLWKIDSIQIKKNWRTRDKIIIRELQFYPGETVDKACIENSINQIWNIGNFAYVDYSLDSLSSGGYLMNIQAKDAFTFMPYLSFSGNRKDYNLGLGIDDNNFLGRNISLDFRGNIGTNGKNYNFGITIPRQLLYRNMTLSFRAFNGTGIYYRYAGNAKSSVIAYHNRQVSGGIGNPWHTDYHYTFSPSFSWSLFQHKTDTSLVQTDVPFSGDYEISYLTLSVGESIGIINRKRHQKDGYSVGVGYGVGLGLNNSSSFYQSVGINAAYYKLINRFFEFSTGFSTGYTTATRPSLIQYLGPGNIRGLVTGEESGQGYYSGNIAGGLTYIDRDWFALEQKIYTTFGMAGDRYFDIFMKSPRISVGTGFKIWTPMIPWLSASVHFVWLKGSKNWFYLDI